MLYVWHVSAMESAKLLVQLYLSRLLISHSVGARAMVMLVGTESIAGARSHNSIDGSSIVTGSGESLLQAHYA